MTMTTPIQVSASPLVLRADDGRLLPLNPTRWHGTASPAERTLLARLTGPVLDVGCGPGRLVEGLARRGVAALGVDPAPGAVALARQRGCAVLQRSVFAALPGEGRWACALLLDGNLGIGGDPVRLLQRCRDLVGPAGVVVVEVEPPGWGWLTCRARLERGRELGPWFDWSVIGADIVDAVATWSGLTVQSMVRTAEDRWFAHLGVASRRADACA
jgi:SAM-dependent methyltransferase